jgi:hypothetical protein
MTRRHLRRLATARLWCDHPFYFGGCADGNGGDSGGGDSGGGDSRCARKRRNFYYNAFPLTAWTNQTIRCWEAAYLCY